MSNTAATSHMARHMRGLLGFARFSAAFFFVIGLLGSQGALEGTDKAPRFWIPDTFDITAVLWLVGTGALFAALTWTRNSVDKGKTIPVQIIIAIAAVGGYLMSPAFALGAASAAWGAGLAYAGAREDMDRDAGKSRWPWALLGTVPLVIGAFIMFAAIDLDPDVSAVVFFGPAVLFAIVVRSLLFNRLHSSTPAVPAKVEPAVEVSKQETPATED